MGAEFDLEKLTAACPGWQVDYHDELTSTSDHALRRAGDPGLRTPLLVLTERQTAGRGRGRNSWWSARGALTFSAIVDLAPDFPLARRSLLSLVTALAIRETVASCVAPGVPVQVKWPNDVYLDGRKVCGILLEMSAARSGRSIVGIGVNVNNTLVDAPDDVRSRAIAICQRTSAQLDLTLVLAQIVAQWQEWLNWLSTGDGRLPEIWRPHCLLHDRIVRLDYAGRTSLGRCQGITELGALQLQTEAGVESHVSGVVVSWE